MQICQSDHLIQHRGLTQTSKWREQTAYHCTSCVSLLCPTADSTLGGLASEKIYTWGEQSTVPSTPAPSTPQLLPRGGCRKNNGLSSSPMMASLNGMSHPKGISSREWRNHISADEQIKPLWSLKVKMQNALAVGKEHPSLSSRTNYDWWNQALLFRVSGTSPTHTCWRLGSGPRHDFDSIKEKNTFYYWMLPLEL